MAFCNGCGKEMDPRKQGYYCDRCQNERNEKVASTFDMAASKLREEYLAEKQKRESLSDDQFSSNTQPYLSAVSLAQAVAEAEQISLNNAVIGKSDGMDNRLVIPPKIRVGSSGNMAKTVDAHGDAIEQPVEDIEELLLCAFIYDPFIMSKAINGGFEIGLLKSHQAQKLCEIIFEEYKKNAGGAPIDGTLVKSRVSSLGIDSMVVFLNRVLSHDSPKLAQVNSYIDFLRDRKARENILTISDEMRQFVHNPQADTGTFMAEISKRIRDLQRHRTRKDVVLIKEQMLEIVQEVNYRNEHGDVDTLGYSIKPFNDLNSALSGLRKGFLYGIAGAPRRGKTTFTLEIATTLAANNNVPVLFYTWEQTRKNLTYRLLAKETQINPDVLQRKRIKSVGDNELKFATGWRRMESYMERFYLIEGSREDTVERIKAHAYNVMGDFETDEVVLFFDYLQKMPLSRDYGSEKFKVEELSTLLKLLSLELNCPIVVISSLNKEGCEIDAEDSPTRPNIYHCKGSGDIEYDLDAAMVMAKDWEDTRELKVQMKNLAESMGKDSEFLPKVDIVNIHLDKNRDAPESLSPIVQYFFFIEANKFVELGYKVESDIYRFRKIEGVLKDLVDSGYIRFRNRGAAQQAKNQTIAGAAPRIRLKQ